jgi:hypothetical protein
MNLHTPKIDSLRLIIPFNEVRVNPNHSEFLRTLTTVNEDAEVISSNTNNTYRLHSNPCSCHYLKAFIIDNGISTEVLKLGFSSKTLKADYFDGINATNIDAIYDFIISENVITITKETLLNARVVDTDICYDLLLEDSNVKDVISHSKQLSIAHKQTNTNAFQQAINIGIEWSDRNKVGKSYLKKQYLKYYAKALELKHNSTLFYETYIERNQKVKSYIQDSKLLRVETTIKNKSHWLTYSIHVTTLKDLLSIKLENHVEIFKRPINHYMQGLKFIQKRTNLTPSDKKDLMLIELNMKYNDQTEIEAIKYLANEIEPTSKQNRYRYTKKLLALVDNNRELSIVFSNKKQRTIFDELEELELIPKSE